MNNVKLDFSGLFGEPPEAPQQCTAPIKEKVSTASKLERQIKDNQDEVERARQIFKEYQANTKKAGTQKTEILQGLQRGENIYKLFLTACDIVAATTGDTGFYNQVKNSISMLYGDILQEPKAIEIELSEAEKRLAKLETALQRVTDGNEKHRIKKAIDKHKEAISLYRQQAPQEKDITV